MRGAPTDRIKLNPPLGRMPTLQFVLPGELAIDPTYQRSIAGDDSQRLIRRIAQHWNWDLCQPLVVSRRRGTDQLFVIDGQHRLEAARVRGDISQLPCVIVDYSNAADEAASFVNLNQQRRPLTKIDVFRAALASGDSQAQAIVAALDAAGLTLAPHTNATAWKVGQIGNVGGIEAAWKTHGEAVTAAALKVLAQGFSGQVLHYAGTIFPGVVAICADGMSARGRLNDEQFEMLVNFLGRESQARWRSKILSARAGDEGPGMARAAALVLRRELTARTGPVLAGQPVALPIPRGRAGWCEQCEMRVDAAEAGSCRSRYCKMKVAA